MIKQKGNATIWVAIITTIGVIAAALIQSNYFSQGNVEENLVTKPLEENVKACLANFMCEDNAMTAVKLCRETIEDMNLSTKKSSQEIMNRCYGPMSKQLNACWDTTTPEQKHKKSAQCESLLKYNGIVR